MEKNCEKLINNNIFRYELFLNDTKYLFSTPVYLYCSKIKFEETERLNVKNKGSNELLVSSVGYVENDVKIKEIILGNLIFSSKKQTTYVADQLNEKKCYYEIRCKNICDFSFFELVKIGVNDYQLKIIAKCFRYIGYLFFFQLLNYLINSFFTIPSNIFDISTYFLFFVALFINSVSNYIVSNAIQTTYFQWIIIRKQSFTVFYVLIQIILTFFIFINLKLFFKHDSIVLLGTFLTFVFNWSVSIYYVRGQTFCFIENDEDINDQVFILGRKIAFATFITKNYPVVIFIICFLLNFVLNK